MTLYEPEQAVAQIATQAAAMRQLQGRDEAVLPMLAQQKARRYPCPTSINISCISRPCVVLLATT